MFLASPPRKSNVPGTDLFRVFLGGLDLSNLDDDELEALERITAKISGQDTNGSVPPS